MQNPTTTITHNDEQFTITYTELLTCDECGNTWNVTRPEPLPDRDPARPDDERRCPSCQATTGHTYTKQTEYYMKYNAIPVENPPNSAAAHADLLRECAREFEALAANEWQLVSSDGVRVVFEKDAGTVSADTTSEYKVTDNLE